MITALVILFPAFAFGQINSTSATYTPPRTVKNAVLVEVQETENYPSLNIKYSTLKIYGEYYSSGKFRKSPDGQTQKVRHENPDFELFPGKHIVKLRYDSSTSQWVLGTSSHGEIIDAEEGKRRTEVSERD